MSLTKTLADLKAKLGRATSTVESELAALRQRITEARKALEHARRAPLPLEEIIGTAIPATVAEAGAWWLKQHGPALVYGEKSLGDPDRHGSRRLPWNPLYGALPWPALCAADPDAAAECLSNLVRKVPYAAGPASSERPALIARLEAELAEFETAEEAMVDAMAAEGLTVAHRPEVVQRRAEAAYRQEQESRAAAARAEREAALNAAHAERDGRRAWPSPYLEGNRPARRGGA